jgi:hypothetical protein
MSEVWSLWYKFSNILYSVHTATVFFLYQLSTFLFHELDASMKRMNQYEYLARGGGWGGARERGDKQAWQQINELRNSTKFTNFPL